MKLPLVTTQKQHWVCWRETHLFLIFYSSVIILHEDKEQQSVNEDLALVVNADRLFIISLGIHLDTFVVSASHFSLWAANFKTRWAFMYCIFIAPRWIISCMHVPTTYCRKAIPLFSAFLFLCSSSSSFSPPCSDEVVVLWLWLSWTCPSKLWETETTQASLQTLSRNVCRIGGRFISGLPSFSFLTFSDEVLRPWVSCMWGSVIDITNSYTYFSAV